MILVPEPHLADLVFEEEGHKYVYQGRVVLSVTQIIRLAGMSSFGIPTGTTRPMQIGTWIHNMLSLHFSNALDESKLTPMMVRILVAVKEWIAQIALVPLIWETPLVHSSYRFAGKPDLIGMIGDTLTVFDWKWGDPRPSDPVQIAGYLCLVRNCFKIPDYTRTQIMPVYLKALLKGIYPEVIDGKPLMGHHTLFMSAQMIVRWREQNGLISKGDEYEEENNLD